MTIEYKVGSLYVIRDAVFRCESLSPDGENAVCRIVKSPSNSIGNWGFREFGYYVFGKGGRAMSYSGREENIEFGRCTDEGETLIERVIEP